MPSGAGSQSGIASQIRSALAQLSSWRPRGRTKELATVAIVFLLVGAAIPSGALSAAVTAVTGPHVEIDAVDIGDTGPYHAGERVTARVTIRNTGTSQQTVYVGFDAVGPQGAHYNNNGGTDKAVTVGAGETRTVMVSWRVEKDAPVGTYGAVFAVWNSRHSDGSLSGQLAETTRESAFTVEPAPATVRIKATDQEGDPVSGVTVRIPALDRTTQTNASGSATLSGIEPGSYQVVVKTHAVTIEMSAKLTAGETWTRSVRLQTRTSVSGAVQIEDGPKLADVTVQIGNWATTTDSNGDFQFSHQFAPGTYEVTIRVEGRPIVNKTVQISGSHKILLLHPSDDESFIGDLAESLSPYNQGIVFGEWGFKHPNVVPGANTLSYQLGWLGGSIVPGVDVLADARDCLVKSGAVGSALDCGGLLVSAVGSAGTIAGIVGTPVTLGGSLALTAASSSLDTAEDASDIAKISTDFLTTYPAKAKAFGGSLAETVPSGFITRAISKVEDSDVVFKLRKWALYRSSVKTLSETGVDSSVIDDLVKRGDDSVKQAAGLVEEGLDSDAVTTIVKRHDDPAHALETVRSLKKSGFSAEQLSTIVKQGTRIDDVKILDDAGLNPGTITDLSRVVSATRFRTFADDVHTLRTTDSVTVTGLDRALAKLDEAGEGGLHSAFKGVEGEVGFAATKADDSELTKIELENKEIANIVRRPGDIDVVTSSRTGRKIGYEVKNADFTGSVSESFAQTIGDQNKGLQELVNAGRLDDYEFKFTGKLSADHKAWLRNHGIPFKHMSNT